MIENESDRLVSQLLDELGPADPPAGFTRNVMARIVSEDHTTSKRTTPLHQEGSVMTRKAMWGLAAAAAITLAVLSIKGFPTVGRGTEGTIGAAKKFDGQQLASKDVVLGDAAAQEFLQSAEFDRLVKDPDARSLLGAAALQPYLRDARFLTAVQDANVRDAMTDSAVASIFASNEARAELEAELNANVAGAEARNASAAAALNAATRAQIAQVLSNDTRADALRNDSVRQMLTDPGVRDLMSQSGIAAAMHGQALAAAVAQAGFSAAAMSGRLESAMAGR
jgi:hypothetical protein